MRSLIKVLAVLLICLVGIGFYRGWFSLTSPKPDARGNKGDKVNVNLSVDEGKIKSDVKKAEEKVKEEIEESRARGRPRKRLSDVPVFGAVLRRDDGGGRKPHLTHPSLSS